MWKAFQTWFLNTSKLIAYYWYNNILNKYYFILFYVLFYFNLGVSVFCRHVYLCTISMECLGGQRRVLDPLGLELQMEFEQPCGCWELIPGPLEEQPVILTTELSL